ncbi:anti-sigma factor family protein [Streptomyces sp. NBC_01803]|uniref:anti-sigma factor family protein n=1 Tax=Streptomyces sp. NBC_01803 TaxID=2975946 RepID=UPI002DDB57CC|nr:zf-HC2 domain-containing protein [Streptomyces sp. NBC_01803]WSA46021.1 anti-sigma factor [Streptomyces sp. NBC_01803]
MTSAAETGPADHHLGESLAALVDGELSHDSRDRVLAHLATCPSCKAEADAQRELKSVFAASSLPTPSDGLLARLQGLPSAADDASSAEPPEPTGRTSPAGSPADRSSTLSLGLLPGGRQRESLLAPPPLGTARGFRIHEPGVPRAHRGHRLAFAAAGAVSLAAFAIGGAMTTAGPGGGTVTAGSSTASSVAGSGATPVSGARTVVGRSDEESRLPAVLTTAQAAGLAVLSAPAGPVMPSGQLFPLFRASLALGSVSAPGSAATPGPSLFGAVSPR